MRVEQYHLRVRRAGRQNREYLIQVRSGRKLQWEDVPEIVEKHLSKRAARVREPAKEAWNSVMKSKLPAGEIEPSATRSYDLEGGFSIWVETAHAGKSALKVFGA